MYYFDDLQRYTSLLVLNLSLVRVLYGPTSSYEFIDSEAYACCSFRKTAPRYLHENKTLLSFSFHSFQMTSSYQHPFQKLCCVGSVQGCSNLLLAAAGPHVFSFDLGSGELLARWPSKIPEEDDSDATEERIDENSGEPPNKKRKIASSTRQGESSDSSLSVEIVAERAKGQRRKPRTAISVLPKVSHLIATRNRKHVVAVTTEDKCIRVFEIRKGARLKLLSER